jgi:hypothetical protein
MAKSQRKPLNPPTQEDRQMLLDYTATIQYSLADLFQAAHDHLILSADPKSTDGSLQQVSIVDTGSSVYMVVKTSRGWFKSPAFAPV